MDLFRTAVDGLGDRALVDRAVTAAEHLPHITAIIEANTAPSG